MCSDGRALNDEALTRVAGRIHSALRGCLTANPHCAPAQAIRATTSSQSPPFQAPGQKTKSLSRPAAPCSAPAEPPPEAPTFPCAYISLGFPERRVDCYRPLPLGRVALPERASRAVPCMSHRSAGRGLIRPGKDSNLIEVVFFFCLMRPGARAGRCHGAIEREPRPRGVAKRLRSTARARPSPLASLAGGLPFALSAPPSNQSSAFRPCPSLFSFSLASQIACHIRNSDPPHKLTRFSSTSMAPSRKQLALALALSSSSALAQLAAKDFSYTNLVRNLALQTLLIPC